MKRTFMNRRGYVFSLMVFLLFLSVFIILAAFIKSLDVMQDSSYDRISIMKASNIARNLDYLRPYVKQPGGVANPTARCSTWKNDLDLPNLPVVVIFDCQSMNPGNPPSKIIVSLRSGAFNSTVIFT